MGKIIVHEDSFVAGADLSSAQYRYMEMSAANTVTQVNAATDDPIGILQDHNTQGNPVNVAMVGRCFLVAGGVVAVGAKVGPDAQGRGVAKTTADNVVNAIALTAAAAAGDVFEVFLFGPFGRYRTAA